MAVLSFSSAIRDKVARRLYSSDYAGCDANQQALLDGAGASALVEVQQAAQWFELVAATAVTDVFEPWLVEETIYKLADNPHPERDRVYRAKVDRAKFMALGNLARNAINSAVTSTSEGWTYTLQNVRYYVVNHCVRLPEPFMPAIESIDAGFERATRFLWNKGNWHFRRRPAVIVITRVAITDGTWTAASRTLSSASITTAIAAGSMVVITGGTGATAMTTTVGTAGAGSCVLEGSISSSNLTTGDITATFITVTFRGLMNGETFDSIASFNWLYDDAGYQGSPLRWASSDSFAFQRAGDGTDDGNEGRPNVFRTFADGDTVVWQFSPVPDQTYTAQGEVLVRQYAAPSSVTDAAPFSAFPTEFMPTLREMVLDYVLCSHGRANAEIHRRVANEVEGLFPDYQNVPGDAAQGGSTVDVYQDREWLVNEFDDLGARM